MIGSRPRSTLLAVALGLLLGGGVALPALAETPLGLRDHGNIDYGATTMDAALNAFLSNADRSATASAFDLISAGRFTSPGTAALRDLDLGQTVIPGAYDSGQASGAFAAPVGDALQAALRDRATGPGNFTVAASQRLAPIGRGMLADRTTDAFGRLSFGQSLDTDALAAAFAAQTSGDGALRDAMRADASESSLFADRGGSFAAPVSSDVLAGAFASESEATGAFAAPVAGSDLLPAMRSEGSVSGFAGEDDGALSVAVDLDELVAGLASDSLDQGDAVADASLSASAPDHVLSAMRAEPSGGSFLAAAAGLSRPEAVDFERIGAILAGADDE